MFSLTVLCGAKKRGNISLEPLWGGGGFETRYLRGAYRHKPVLGDEVVLANRQELRQAVNDDDEGVECCFLEAACLCVTMYVLHSTLTRHGKMAP